MNKALIISKLTAITDHHLLGTGSWPPRDVEVLATLSKTLIELGLEEEVPGPLRSSRSTVLGKEMSVDLIMAFVGLWELMEIPGILESSGYLDADEAENLWSIWAVSPKKAERMLHRYVLRAYLKFCNRSELPN